MDVSVSACLCVCVCMSGSVFLGILSVCVSVCVWKLCVCFSGR